MRLFALTAKYLIPVIVVLWLAQQSPLGEKNGTIVVAILLTVCSLPQFIWLMFRLGRNMLLIRGMYAFWVIYEIALLLVLTIGAWIWAASL